MGFIAWLFGSKPCFRTDGFESIMAHVFVVTWSAKFKPTRSSLRVDRFDSVYLGDFEPMEDTWVDPVGSNKATQDGLEEGLCDGFEAWLCDGFEHDFRDGFERSLWMVSKHACLMVSK